ncbi:MAG: hypothetical protein ISQ14_05130 [Verrucomicrobiae bacterium]|nr:hypothetical protein [Verrucomicrobiae bacterium]
MKFKTSLWILILSAVLPARAQDFMHFLDGSRLRGHFVSYETNGAVALQSPHAPEPLRFTSGALSRVILEQRMRNIPADRYSARFNFFNGDRLYGDLISLDEKDIVFKSWFAGRLTGSREDLQSITFFNHGSHVVYSGPSGTAGWNVDAPTSWRESDGFLHGGPNAFMGRDFRLPDKVSVEFKLMWDSALNIIVSLFTESSGRYNYPSHGYQLNVGVGYANLTRGSGAPGMSPMGSVGMPLRTGRQPVTYEIRLDREKAVVALLMDGQLIHRWVDPAGFASEDMGVSFQNRSAQVSIGAIRVTEWDGGFEDADALAGAEVTSPTLKLVNHDTFAADIGGITDDRVEFQSDGLTLRIPLQRVKHLIFPNPILQSESDATHPEEPRVQAHLMTDERLTLYRLHFARHPGADAGAKPGSANGRALLFGDISLIPDWITELSFNPNQAPQPFAVPGIGPDGYWTLQ